MVSEQPKPVEPKQPFMSVPGAIIVAGLLIAASVLFVGSGGTASLFHGPSVAPAQQADGSAAPIDTSKLEDGEDPVLGNADAKVTIVEFSDFQCPYCRSFYNDTFALLKKTYIDTGKVRLVFRDFPLTSLHPSARPAALAGACAAEQGKFWQFHDAIFAGQDAKDPSGGTVSFSVSDIKTWVSNIGLDMTKFNQCLDSQKYASEVDKDQADGTALGVDGTPSFFINGVSLVGAQPFAAFQQVIDAALAK